MSVNKHSNWQQPEPYRQDKESSVEERIRAIRISINNRELLIAASEGNLEEVDRLLKTGADVNFKDSNGYTVLHYAVIQENEEVVKALLENGADINIEDNDDKNPFEIAGRKNENIIRILGKEIVDKSFKIIENSELRQTSSSNRKFTSPTIKGISFEEEKNSTEKKIESLYQRLEDLTPNDNELTYEQANIFILFLETFAFQSISRKEIKKNLVRHFLDSDKFEERLIADTRRLIMKSKNKIINLCHVKKIIEICYGNEVAEGQAQVTLFFDELKEYVKCKMGLRNGLHGDTKKFSSFFKQFPRNDEREEIGEACDESDPYNKLKDLVLEGYKKGKNLEQHWFEFVVNAYPALDLDKGEKENLSNIEIQIKHLRNNLVHGFYRYGVQEFREAIVNLRGKLFEYYFSKKVHNGFESLTPGKDIEEIKDDFNKDLKELQYEFKDSGELLSEEEAKGLFGYKFFKSVFAKQSPNYNDSALKSLVEEYFKYMSLIEDINRVNEDNSRNGETTSVADKDLNYVDINGVSQDQYIEKEKNSSKSKKLNDVARREIFEKFVRLKRIKENFTGEIYIEERRKLMTDLEHYGVENIKLNIVCKYYLEEGKSFNKEISEIVEDVVKFIQSISQIRDSDCDYKEKEIVFLGELLLNKDIVNKELILSENIDLKNELRIKAEKNCKIIKLMDQVESFSNVCIQVDKIVLEIDVRQTVKNILRTFGNAYNEYRVEFDIESIFSRGTFLNELVWQDIKERDLIAKSSKSLTENAKYLDTKTFFIIHKLIDIEYMSPYIVNLIASRIKNGGRANQIIDNNNFIKLIDNLLNKEEYISYLNILLSVEVKKFNMYETLYNKILEKKVDISNIRSVFKEFKHIDKFTGVFKLAEPNKDQHRNNIIHLAKNFLTIINEEAADRLYNTTNYNEALEILNKGKEIHNKFKDVLEDSYPDFIYRDILMARIKNKQEKYEEAWDILTEVKSKLETSMYTSHNAKFVLTLSDIAYTNKLSRKYSTDKYSYGDLYSEVIKYVLYLDDISERFDVAQTVKEKYNQIKNLTRYKNLLSSSELLHSGKYLDILKIAEDAAGQIMQLNNNEKGYNDALKIYEEVYSCYKDDVGNDHKRTIQVIENIAFIHSKLGDIFKDSKRYSDALFYYQRALFKYGATYSAREKIFGPDYDALMRIRDTIETVMNNIANMHDKLGDVRYNSQKIKEAQNNYEEALQFHEKLYNSKNVNLQHKHALTTRNNIAYMHDKLARLGMVRAQVACGDILLEVLQHYKLARQIHGELKEKKCKKSEEEHEDI